METLLEDRKQFVVPLFQRPYSWKKRNWEELWRDLLDISDPANSREHFMGAIVTMPIEMKPHGVNKFLLIDGQQRLTTILVILACIRDLAGDESDLHDEIENIYLTNRYKQGTNRSKLLPTQEDRKAYQGIIQNVRQSDSSLSKLYDYFAKELAARDEDSEAIDLGKFFNSMKSQLLFVSIVLDENDNPYHIFHSLNATGTPLTQADLVRNHIFMHIPEEDQEDAYNDLWYPLQQAYPGNQLRDYIWRFITKDGVPIRQIGVYDAIRRRVADLATSDSADHLLMDLKIVAEHYDRILDPSLETVRPIRERLQRLKRWELTTAYPLLLNLYIAFNSQAVSAQTFCDVLDVVESFVVRRHICNVPIRQLTNYFIRVFHEASGERDFVSALCDYLIEHNFPTDEVFRDNWVRHQLYGPGSRDKCKLILESLESHATQNNEPVDTRHPRITIEHVMPQSLSQAWYEELGSGADAIHVQYVHTIGNLTLTGQNESMGNKPFAEKKEVFAQSNFGLNKYFAGCDSWNAESIVRRAERLGEVAVKIWQRPSP
ncbi:MAG: DUF262 domain-containing protein [Chloroflexi bacterium]|nr:DUF262 domain-containing protein [Chloroflexota bacterium]